MAQSKSEPNKSNSVHPFPQEWPGDFQSKIFTRKKEREEANKENRKKRKKKGNERKVLSSLLALKN